MLLKPCPAELHLKFYLQPKEYACNNTYIVC